MKFLEWIAEVRRVGHALGLNEKGIEELTLWSIEMQYDHLERAQDFFKVDSWREESLARRLIQDVELHLGGPDYL